MRAGLAKAHAFAKEDPVNPTYDIVSGELYETAGRRGEALELLEKTVAARPSADALIEVLSSFCARAGDSGKAEAVLNIRLQTDPNDFLYREKRDDCQRGRGWELSVHRGTSWCKESMLETY